MIRLCLPLLLFVASCNPCCFGQISLSEQKVQVVSGLVAPQVVGDAIIIGAESKPVIQSAALVTVEPAQKYETIRILAEQIPTLEQGEIKSVGDYKWLLTGTGRFRITAYAATPGLEIEQKTVELTNEPPKPPPGPEPPKPPEPSNDTDRLVDTAMLDLRRGYGRAFAAAHAAIVTGQVTVDSQLQAFLEPITRQARMDALAGIDSLLQDKLPRDGQKLKPEAAGFIQELSVSFERGTK